jgi:4,5-dihydroxyphthalate decarboxylase
MSKKRITMGLPYHPRTRALIDGEIEIDGYELSIKYDVSPGERHYLFTQGEFDIGETSAATFLRTREKGLHFLALPIFFERGPRQRNIFYCEGKVEHPSDLKGKKVGCFRYGATAVVWARGFLLDEYNLKTTDMQWYVSGREVYIGKDLPVRVERLEPPPPFGEEKPHLAKLLSEGEIHAALVAGDSGYTGLFGGGVLPKAMGEFPGVKPLFDNTDAIIRYVQEERIYPIIHLVAVKEQTLQKYPGLAAKVIEAFKEAKRLSVKYLSPADLQGYEREKAVLGEDPYAYVLGETEKRTMSALGRYQVELNSKASLEVVEATAHQQQAHSTDVHANMRLAMGAKGCCYA